ncbi:hypothetical protein [Streptomyces sp. NPDC048603]|uniref:hypothetical protein n=1 Tax=Streptomyces sp. NPDC048603 TaxID=3365577 RepID=UPI00371778AD
MEEHDADRKLACHHHPLRRRIDRTGGLTTEDLAGPSGGRAEQDEEAPAVYPGEATGENQRYEGEQAGEERADKERSGATEAGSADDTTGDTAGHTETADTGSAMSAARDATEDLRVALQQYRSFFNRLLST